MRLSADAIWDRIIDINDPDFFVARDTMRNFYLTGIPHLETSLLTFGRPAVYAPHLYPAADTAFFWYIQIGAFGSRDNAVRTQESYLGRGLPAVLEETDMCRVKIGGFKDKETARYFVDAGGLTGWLVLQQKIESRENIIFSLNSENYRFNNGIITKEQP
jgi:hypothetical protein